METCFCPKFSLGRLVFTPAALLAVPFSEIRDALWRHVHGDWGDLTPEDVAINERALKAGEQLLSAYVTKAKIRFWVITEGSRSITTVLLPEDY